MSERDHHNDVHAAVGYWDWIDYWGMSPGVMLYGGPHNPVMDPENPVPMSLDRCEWFRAPWHSWEMPRLHDNQFENVPWRHIVLLRGREVDELNAEWISFLQTIIRDSPDGR